MIANTDQTVKAEQPKPRRYGRHPLNIVKRMVQAKLSKNQMVVYMTLGEYFSTTRIIFRGFFQPGRFGGPAVFFIIPARPKIGQ